MQKETLENYLAPWAEDNSNTISSDKTDNIQEITVEKDFTIVFRYDLQSDKDTVLIFIKELKSERLRYVGIETLDKIIDVLKTTDYQIDKMINAFNNI